MKSKRRHRDSSEESADSDESERSSSSSDSESDASSESDHRSKKKKKRAESSDSDSDSDDRRAKKRKHKKKKKKHGKKKRRNESDSNDQVSVSEGEISVEKKRKHKHKHSKRAPSSESEGKHSDRRMHSVVKDRRAESVEERPPKTYYQKDYHQSAPVEYDREAEVERFYRGSSKDRRSHYQDDYYYDKHTDRMPPEPRDKYHGQYGEYSHRPKDYEEQKRSQRYEPRDDYYKRRERDPREEPRGKYNEYERGRRKEYFEEREFQHRRGPPEPDAIREREYPKPERYDREHSRSPEEQREKRRVEMKEERVSSRERDGRPDRREKKSRFTDAENKEYSWGKTEVKKEPNQTEKEKPNFGLSGKLTADTNTVNGVVIKYTEPDDAKQPKRRWRFYPFKGDKALPILYIHRQSAFLLGRDKKVCDIPLEHPSISKQHAALQYRATPFTRDDGSTGRRVRPYIIDLDSANGTFVNNKKIEPRRYVELLERDVVKFAFSQREYVLLHENSKDDAMDDDATTPAPVTTDSIKRDKRMKEEIAEDG